MLGILVKRNQKINTISIMVIILLILQFSVMSATEKTVKVRERQSTAERMLQSSLTSTENTKAEKSTQQSNITAQHRAVYKDVSDPAVQLETQRVVTQKKQRTVNKQSLSHEFFFDSVNVYMDTDLDGDGYYSEFTVNFDADTIFNVATVYARLYLSLNGGDWELYHTTGNFNLEGYSGFDDFSVSTILTSGYPPGNYDILIDLYDEYDNSLVATISADDDYGLSNLYLEDVSYEGSVGGDARYSVFSTSITLLTDNDLDGYYQSFSLQFDADIDFGTASVYAEVWMKDSNNNWSLEHTTEDFQIEGYSTTDTYILESVLETGYQTGLYDFRVDIFDSYSSNFLTSTESLSYELSDVPLEDAVADARRNSSANTAIIVASSDSIESGGAGSSGVVALLLMMSIYLRRLYRAKIS